MMMMLMMVVKIGAGGAGGNTGSKEMNEKEKCTSDADTPSHRRPGRFWTASCPPRRTFSPSSANTGMKTHCVSAPSATTQCGAVNTSSPSSSPSHCWLCACDRFNLLQHAAAAPTTSTGATGWSHAAHRLTGSDPVLSLSLGGGVGGCRTS